MKRFIQYRKAVSLTELLVTLVVFTVIGVAVGPALLTVSKTSQRTQKGQEAVNLLRAAQEEVRAYAHLSDTNYNFLSQNQCSFDPANPCGFTVFAEKYPGFTVTLVVEDIGGTEFKQFLIETKWQGITGKEQNMKSVLQLARPATKLPGNIEGRIIDRDTGNPISGAIVKAEKILGSSTKFVTSTNRGGNNYDFSSSGTYVLSPGVWEISATHPQYQPYNNGERVTVESRISSTGPLIEMISLFQNATIHGTVIDINQNPISASINGIGLYQNGNRTHRRFNTREYSFEVQFSSSSEQCFTLATIGEAWRKEYVGNFNCDPSLTHEGRGWSSAVTINNQHATTPVCSGGSYQYPWVGTSAADRICVDPGEDLEVNIPFVDMPRTTISGMILDEGSNPVPFGNTFVRWPNWLRWSGSPVTADGNGNYTIEAPATQAIFPNQQNSYAWIWAWGHNQTVDGCCNSQTQIRAVSNSFRIGPLYAGGSINNYNITVLDPEDIECGDAQGQVKDDLSGNSISGAEVTISLSVFTNATGDYMIECSGSGYRLPEDSYILTTEKSGYYTKSTYGNSIYKRSTSANIQRNAVTTQPLQEILNIGKGNLLVEVKDQVTQAPILGASVSISGPENQNQTATTGSAAFNNITETWPKAALLSSPKRFKYNLTPERKYRIDAGLSGNYLPNFVTGVTLDEGESKTVTIHLVPKGGM